ncbi:MAG: hypothetical protein ACHQ53_00915 [Polyangiales bacterium]
MRPRLRDLILGLGLFALVATGCKVGKADVDTWKGTVKGPGKMVAVILADKYDVDLRSYAALALVDMERHDVDGVAELLNVIAKVDATTRDQVIAAIVPGLTQLMQASDAAATPEGPPARQVRAKDAAFALITYSSADSRKALTQAVMKWYMADFNGRSLSGNYSAEQVVRALGSSAATILVDGLSAEQPQQALVKLAELIGQLGDADAKKRAGQKLVAIEVEMRSDNFLKWLKAQIVAQLGAAAAQDAQRVEKTAQLNREKFIDEGAIPAMAYLADQVEVSSRLLAIAAEKSPALTERRTRALRALEGKVNESQLHELLSLALDPSSPAAVQDYAFDRVGDIRSPKAIPPMWPLVQDGEKQRERWRAGELVLAIGGSSVLSEFFSKLPKGNDVRYEPEELDGYAGRMGQMNPLPTAVASSEIGSPNWWDRVIALDFFLRKGTEADLPAMSRLLQDKAAVKGKNWPPGTTVGQLAKQAIDGLRERLGRPRG